MKKQENQFHNDPRERDFYETGSTQPPKNHGGVISVLLVVIIILGSVATGLGLLNVRLFRLLAAQRQTQDTTPLLSACAGQTTSEQTTQSALSLPNGGTPSETQTRLGLECVSVSEFDRSFYQLPYGCLVLQVEQNSCADAAGILSGDVIVALERQAVTSTDALSQALDSCAPGQTVSIRLYRSRTGQYVTLEAVLDPSKP